MLWRIGAKSGREISEADVTVLLSLQKYCQVVFDNASTQYYCCVIIPQFDADGLLPPGVHWANWDELTDRLGNNPWRQHLMTGLRAALENLKGAGCRIVYLNGSFVTSKDLPNDYDACWDEVGVEPVALGPVLLTFDPDRATQKAKYMGDCSQRQSSRVQTGCRFLSSSRQTRTPGDPKGSSP